MRDKLIKEIIKSLKKNPNYYYIAFNDDILMEYIIYLISEEDSIETKLFNKWLRKRKYKKTILYFKLAIKNFIKLLYTCCFLFNRAANQIRSFSIYNNNLYLTSSPIHLEVAKKIDNNIQFKNIYIKLKLKIRFKILLKFLFKFPFYIIRLWVSINSISDTKIRKSLKKSFIIIVLVFAQTYIYYNILYSLIRKSIIDNNLNNVMGFEFGIIGTSVTDVCSDFNIKSIFAQHGIFSSGYLIPTCFNKFFLLAPWDKYFIENLLECEINCTYLFKKKWLDYEKVEFENKKALFALEYPSSGLSADYMINKINFCIREFQKNNWDILLRPHPRDPTGSYYNRIEINSPRISFDPYLKENLDLSLKLNKVTILITLTSTSVYEAIKNGVLPVALYSSTWKKSVIDFNILCYVINDLESLKEIASMDLKKISDILDEKKNRFKEFYY